MNDRGDAGRPPSRAPDEARREEGLSTADLADGPEWHHAKPPAPTTAGQEQVAVPVEEGSERQTRERSVAEQRQTQQQQTDDSSPAAASIHGAEDRETESGGSQVVAGTPAPSASTDPGAGDRPQALFSEGATASYRSQWDAVQASFVDEPRSAVQQADSLVAQLMKELARTFAEERAGLESQWDRGDDVSTEDLRIALQRYRSFFDRLLSL